MYLYAQSGKAAEGAWAWGGGICHGLSGESGYALEEILSKEYEQIDGFYPSVWVAWGKKHV